MRNSDTLVDALIVGGGPAGLGAALALCRMNHSSIVFDSGDYRNNAASEMHMVSTWDHRSPQDFRAAARAELLGRYAELCTFVDSEVLEIERLKPDAVNAFEIHDAGGDVWRGRKVVLATGSRDLLPFIDGLDVCWGSGVVHCLLCHGHEHLGAESVGILALDKFAEPSTLLRVLRSCRQFASRVYIYTNGNTRAAVELRATTSLVPGTFIESALIDRLEAVPAADGTSSGLRVLLEGGHVSEVLGFTVYHPGTEQASYLPEGLGVDIDVNGDIKLGNFQETSQRGIFAAGDCASPHKYISIASATGNMAGAGVAQQLQAEIKYT